MKTNEEKTKSSKTKLMPKEKEEKEEKEEEKEDSPSNAKIIKLERSSPNEESNNEKKICLMCGKIHNKDDIFKYLSVLPEDERYKCHYCSESFSYSCLFAAHLRDCSSSYSSTNDNKADTNATTAATTVTTFGKSAKIIPATNSAKVPSGLQNNHYRCEVCNRIFTSRAVLTNHIERMHGGKGPTECEFCQKKYSTMVDLIIHKKTHIGAAPYQCQYCDQNFINRSMVIEHERIHTGDTPYRCEFCNRGFAYRSNLIVHKRIHDSKRNHFDCDQCGLTFQHGAQLTRHKLVHATDKPLDCKHCGKEFLLYNKLIEHIKEEHQ